MNEAQTAL